MSSKLHCKVGGITAFIIFALALVSINFIDKPLVLYIHGHGFDQWKNLNYITESGIQALSILCLIILCIFPTHKTLWQRLLFLIYIIAIVYIAQFIRQKIGIITGRNWPATWSGSGVYGSLISDNHFSFNFFKSNSWSGSFPSGHCTRTTTMCITMLLIYNRFKYLWILPIVIMMISLVLLNYHYLGDCLGGVSLGVFISYYGFSIYSVLRQKITNPGH